MDTITINIPATPALEKLVAALLKQPGVSVSTQSAVPSQKTPKKFVTIHEGAKIAGVGYSTFRRWVVDRRLIPSARPSGKHQGNIRVKVADIEKLLAGWYGKKTPGPRIRGSIL